MAIYSNIRGVMGSLFQLSGPAGPQWRALAGALEARNATNAAFAIGRGADPVGDDDWVTRRALLAALGGFEMVEYIQEDIAPNAAGNWSFTTAAYPLGSVIEVGTFDVDLTAVADPTVVTGQITQDAPGGIVSMAVWAPETIGGPDASNHAIFALPYRTTAASTLTFSGTGATDGLSGVAVQIRALVRVAA